MQDQENRKTRLIIKTEDDKPVFRICPLGKGETLCYEIEYWREAYKKFKAGWAPTGKYASNLGQAAIIISEYIERNHDWDDPSKKLVNDCYDEAVFSELHKVAARFENALSLLKIEEQ